MKWFSVICLIGVACCAWTTTTLAQTAGQTRTVVDLSGPWKFSGYLNSKEPTEEAIKRGFHKTDFDDSSWKELRVPLNWFCGIAQGEGGMEFGTAFSDTYTEGWYRKSVPIPSEYNGKRIIFRCDGASVETWVYVNGTQVGYHYGQFGPFELDVSDHVRWGGENLFAVRCRVDKIDEHHGSLVRGGICLPVKLRIVPAVYVQRACINPRIASSKIDIDYSIINTGAAATPATVEGTIGGVTETLGAVSLNPGLNSVTLSMNLKNPHCWSPEDPHLYDLITALKAGNTVLDQRSDRFGFREFIAKGPHFYLNGKRYRIFGSGSYGVSGSPSRWGTTDLLPQEEKDRTKTDFARGKELGVNFLRAHSAYTPPKYVLEAADEVGMLFYNQWSFICGEGKLKGEFLQKHIDDMKDYIYDAYNDPSLVMLTFTNEIFSADAREATIVYDELKSTFPDHPLFTPCSGGSIYTYAKTVKTDVIDLHNYTGWPFCSDEPNVKRSWRFMEDTIREEYAKAKVRCGERPLIVTEFPAWSIAAYWVDSVSSSWLCDGKVTPETYVAATKTPAGLWPISMYDLKNRCLRDRIAKGAGWQEGESLMNKRAAESLRRLGIVEGLEPNRMLNNLLEVYKTLYTRVFICAGVFDTNLFSGGALRFDTYVINDLSEEQRKLTAIIEVLNKKGQSLHRSEFGVDSVAAFAKAITPCEYGIPDDLPTGFYDIKLSLHSGDTVLSNNAYDFYVVNPADLKKIDTTKRVLLLTSAPDEGGGEKAKEILDSLGVEYAPVSPADDIGKALQRCDVLVIAPNYNAAVRSWSELGNTWDAVGESIRKWIAGGGRALSLEQYIREPLPWAPEWDIYDAGNCWYFDMAVPEHPAYAGMSQRNFDSWNAFQGVSDQSYFIRAMTENVISAVGATSDDRYVMAAAEARIGKGSIFASQLNATQRYMKDSAATQYLHNLFSYVLASPLYSDVRDMKDTGVKKKAVAVADPAQCTCIDLKPYANRAFTDETPGDGQGGWTDQGENDLRHVPLGKRTFCGIPFEIIDPAGNNGRSCLMLKGHDQPRLPERIDAIAVNRRAAHLAFLHTAAFCPPATSVGKYIIHYEDQTTQTIDLMAGEQIGDWWNPIDLPEARVAWSGRHPVSGQNVGVYLFRWDNPYPELPVAAVDMISSGTPVPILIALTSY